MGLFDPIAGFWVTLRQMFRPKVTTQYPEQKRTKPQRFHGRHVLNRYPDGMEKCIGCELCAGVCPARCIYVRGKDNPPDDPVSPGERYGFVYEINMLRCIFCGLCVEACPTEAITMTHLFEMSTTNREDAIYTRTELLMDRDGNVPHPEPDNPLIDVAELRIADGWMRATSPSGRTAYEGVVGWTPTAGVGLRPAEAGQKAEGRRQMADSDVVHAMGTDPEKDDLDERGPEGRQHAAGSQQQDDAGRRPQASADSSDEEKS